MSFGLAYFLPHKTLASNKRLGARLQVWLDEAHRSMHAGSGRLRPLQPPKPALRLMLTLGEIRGWLGGVECSGEVPETVLRKHALLDPGALGSAIAGKVSGSVMHLSEVGAAITRNLLEVAHRSNPYGAVGVWVHLLSGSRRVPPLQVGSEHRRWLQAEEQGLTINTIEFLRLGREVD